MGKTGVAVGLGTEIAVAVGSGVLMGMGVDVGSTEEQTAATAMVMIISSPNSRYRLMNPPSSLVTLRALRKSGALFYRKTKPAHAFYATWMQTGSCVWRVQLPQTYFAILCIQMIYHQC